MRRIPVDTLNAASQMMLDRGERILQGVRFADTDEGHVAKLLEFMDPPIGARIADMGCGFGEVARLMRAQRPDLSFKMVNDNQFQLSHAPSEGRRLEPVLADMTNTGLPGGTLDAAMFLYSLCHVNLQAAMAEAARLLKRDGVLFVFDYVRTGGDNKLSEKYLGAHFRRFDRLLAEIGFRFEDHRIAIPAHGDDTLFRSVFNDPDDPDLYPTIFCDLEPMLWRARRKDWM